MENKFEKEYDTLQRMFAEGITFESVKALWAMCSEFLDQIEKLEQDKKVLVDGARALKTIISVVKEDDNFEYLSFPHIHIWSNDGDDRYYKIKALLELLEEQE